MKNLLIFVLLLFTINPISAQSVQVNYGFSNTPVSFNNLASGNIYIQQVTITEKTKITHFGININSPASTNFIAGIYEGQTLIGNSDFAGTTINSGTTNSVPLVSPVTVNSGTYNIIWHASDAIGLGNDGTTSGRIGRDLYLFGPLPNPAPFFLALINQPNYSVFLTGIIESGATSIPTMSQWGLFLLGLLIMNLSVFFVQRRDLV